MGLSREHVRELVEELAPQAVGTECVELLALPPRDVVLLLQGPNVTGSGPLRLRLSADPEAARIHLQGAPARRHGGSVDPFFDLVRQELLGTTLHALAHVRGDRIVRLSFRRAGQPAAELVGELTGRHANLILLDGAGRVRASLVPPAEGSRAAERLQRGAAYAVPPGRGGSGSGEAEPSIADTFPDAQGGGRNAPLSARVEAALGRVSDERFAAEQRRDLERRLERRLEQAAALASGLERRSAACDEAERVRQDAELLLAHLTSIARGSSVAELPDDFVGPGARRTIPLDPGLSPRRNAEKLFARYKKLVRTLEHLPEELARARAAHERVAALLARARAAASHEETEALEAEALSSGLLAPPQEKPKKARKPEPRLSYLRFQAARGSEIRVGRSAADNDRLTFRESNGNDLWLHTADSPGSHVVLRLQRGSEPDDEEVLDAAHLAVHFSPLRGASRADVHVARRKEVHKPRKARPGLVTLSGGKVVRVRLEPGRIERLLRGARDAGPGGPRRG